MKAPSESAKAEALDFSRPWVVSPKIDGFRALGGPDGLVSKTLRPFPNEHLRVLFGKLALRNLDGELVVGKPYGPDVIKRTSSGLTSRAGEPKATLWVFDWFGDTGWEYWQRWDTAAAVVKRLDHPNIRILPYRTVRSAAELLDVELKCLAKGYEGLMLRRPDGPYKEGTCTHREGYLLKFKRFVDAEAVVVGVSEGRCNLNEATVRADGVKRRSTAKENMVGNRMVGTIHAMDVKTGRSIDVAPGRMTASERSLYFKHFNSGGTADVKGLAFTYRSFPVAEGCPPRFPTFQVFRDLTLT